MVYMRIVYMRMPGHGLKYQVSYSILFKYQCYCITIFVAMVRDNKVYTMVIPPTFYLLATKIDDAIFGRLLMKFISLYARAANGLGKWF